MRWWGKGTWGCTPRSGITLRFCVPIRKYTLPPTNMQLHKHDCPSGRQRRCRKSLFPGDRAGAGATPAASAAVRTSAAAATTAGHAGRAGGNGVPWAGAGCPIRLEVGLFSTPFWFCKNTQRTCWLFVSFFLGGAPLF